jgi:hypothetical protein
MVVGLDFGRFWPQRRVATGTIRRRNGLLMWELAGWRRRYHLLQRERQTLDSIDSIQFNSTQFPLHQPLLRSRDCHSCSRLHLPFFRLLVATRSIRGIFANKLAPSEPAYLSVILWYLATTSHSVIAHAIFLRRARVMAKMGASAVEIPPLA